jgi:hypothetical protein
VQNLGKFLHTNKNKVGSKVFLNEQEFNNHLAGMSNLQEIMEYIDDHLGSGGTGTGDKSTSIQEFDNAWTYPTGSMVYYNNEVYSSLIDNNVGNNPITSSSAWKIYKEVETVSILPPTGEIDKLYIKSSDWTLWYWNSTTSVYEEVHGGLGDMQKSIYDIDDDSIVDKSEALSDGSVTITANQVYTHLTNITTNPHNVDKYDVGLGNVDNTSDLNKPISTATQNALNSKQDSLPPLTGNEGKVLAVNPTATDFEYIDIADSVHQHINKSALDKITDLDTGEKVLFDNGVYGKVDTVHINNQAITLEKLNSDLIQTSGGGDNTKLTTKGYVDAIATGGIQIQGVWNADTNTPTLDSSIPIGHAYLVTIAGATDLNGITDWEVNDIALQTQYGFIKIDNTSVATVWGAIGGSLADQTDLMLALAEKANINHDHNGAYARKIYELIVDGHTTDFNNPHQVQASDVGLGFITTSGSGTTFLADDGTYKSGADLGFDYAMSYTQSFVSSDWVVNVGGFRLYIPETTHKLPTKFLNVVVYEENTSFNTMVQCAYHVTDGGDVYILSSVRFDGYLSIYDLENTYSSTNSDNIFTFDFLPSDWILGGNGEYTITINPEIHKITDKYAQVIAYEDGITNKALALDYTISDTGVVVLTSSSQFAGHGIITNFRGNNPTPPTPIVSTIEFSNITGDPYDNTNLALALDVKADTETDNIFYGEQVIHNTSEEAFIIERANQVDPPLLIADTFNNEIIINGTLSPSLISVEDIRYNYVFTSVDMTAEVIPIIFVNAELDIVVITLPLASSCDGRQYTIKKVDSSTNSVVIQSQNSETIDGQLFIEMPIQNESHVIMSANGNWYIV